MNLTQPAILIIGLTLLTGCGSTEGGVPKSRFLTTGESRPNADDEDNRTTTRRMALSDEYRTNTDRTITTRMRAEIDNDASLSLIGGRVGISTVDGNITLRGSVPTEKDKAALGRKAQEVAGTGNVSNQLVVQGY